MDCYIVRVYRHIAGRNGQPDEIAGLVENVGRQETGKPFSTYVGLVEAIRTSFLIQSNKQGLEGEHPAGDIRTVRRSHQPSSTNKP